MAQGDYIISNDKGAPVRADFNNHLQAILTQNSGLTEPSTNLAYSTWGDTTLDIFKMRDSTDASWHSLFDSATGELLANLGDGLIVNSGDSGATANALADEFVIEASGAGGMTFLTPDANHSFIFFGSPGDTVGAVIQWSLSGAPATTMIIGSASAGGSMLLLSDNQATNIDLTGGVGSELATFSGDITMTSGNWLMSAGTAHIINGSSGATANVLADELIVEFSGTGGISLLSPDASGTNIYFGSASDNIGSFLAYAHDLNTFTLAGHKVGVSLILKADNNITNLTLSGILGSELAELTGDLTMSSTSPKLTITANDATTASLIALRNTNAAGDYSI